MTMTWPIRPTEVSGASSCTRKCHKIAHGSGPSPHAGESRRWRIADMRRVSRQQSRMSECSGSGNDARVQCPERACRVLADWAAPAPGVMVYVFGSRVRGDHESDSAVDVCFKSGDRLTDGDAKWG